jgi:endonuclease YncB( thermonuclease family)
MPIAPLKRVLAIACALLAPPGAEAATILIDGDTLDIDGKRVGIVEIDTPETFRPRCENELVRGLNAKEQLRNLLSTGDVTFQPTGHDLYGRILARVYAGKVNVGQQLIAEGFALRYLPGPEAKAARLKAWCG